eukprot:GEMP01039348.1.p1 GENE.GEMP01039348.1~~GEMP01039348.1.p1  ORF type:complete len:384 (+),score=96.90 GEMP01039348.1:85-1236(+)
MGGIESIFESPLLEMCYGNQVPNAKQVPNGNETPTFEYPVTAKEKVEGSCDVLSYGMASMQGWRTQHEDAHICIPQMIEGDPKSPALFGVMDGHSGKGVARLTATKLPEILRNNPFFAKQDYETALRSAFLEMDAFLTSPAGRREVMRLDEDKVEGEFTVCRDFPSMVDLSGPDIQGCTCCVSLVVPANETQLPKVYCANVGDSRCVFGSDNMCAALSEDHKPQNPVEAKRILKAGGHLCMDLVGGPRINGGLNVSRAFGDFRYKKTKGLRPHQQMVSPMPDITQVEWPSNEAAPNSFLILACDGIWERNSSKGAVKFVAERIGTMDPTTVCADLCDASLATLEEMQSPNFEIRYSGQDNMTCVIVKPTAALWRKMGKSSPPR